MAVDTKHKVSFWILPFISVITLLFFKLIGILRPDHIFLFVLINAFFYLSSFTRRLITGLTIIIIYWLIYDSMKLWPNWKYHSVDIQPLYELEKFLFGINLDNMRITPNEYFIRFNSTLLDIICALFYLSWIPLPLLFALYLYFTDKNLFLRFCMAFFLVNCIGFIIYYLHPAAPPWYYAQSGSLLDVNTKSNAAGLLRFDRYFGINLFEDLYSKGSNVFAAMPSLHASYPLIGFYYSSKQKYTWMTIIFAIVMAGIWFSAIYLTHHYILDVLAGIACGISGILLYEKILLRNNKVSRFMSAYEKIILPRKK